MAAFYLSNQDTQQEINVYNKTFTILFNPYLFCGKTGQIAHVPSPSSGIAQKHSLHVLLLRQLASSRWGAGAKTLCRAALSWYTQQLNAVHQSGVTAFILAL